MRYRCTKCGDRCTVSLRKGNVPTACVIDCTRQATWVPEKDAPVFDERSSTLRKYMIADAKGFFIRAIDTKNGTEDKVFRSINEASEELGIAKGSISRAVKSQGRRMAGDYCWKRELLTYEQAEIKKAAQTGVEAYRQALKQYDPDRYIEIFGEE